MLSAVGAESAAGPAFTFGFAIGLSLPTSTFTIS
jgi:hypothetical protein